MSAAIETDETLVIETPERVPLHFALASIGNRFIACAIDHTIQIVALIVLVIVFAIISDVSDFGNQFSSMPKWVRALLVVIAFVVWDGYFVLFEWLWRGQTPGKRWLKLRVIREDGRPISFFEAMAVGRYHCSTLLLDWPNLRFCHRPRPANRRSRGRHSRRPRAPGGSSGLHRSFCIADFRSCPATLVQTRAVHRRC